MPPLFLVGGLAGRLLPISTPCPTDYGLRTCRSPRPWLCPTLPPPCRLRMGPQFASCVWLYHCASSPARRLIPATVQQARPTYGRRDGRSHKAYGRTQHSHSPVHAGGPIGRLLNMTVPHFPPCSSWVGPPVTFFTWQCSMHDMPPTGGPGSWAPRVAWTHDGTPRSTASTSRWARLPPTARDCTVGPTASCRWAPGSLIYWQYSCTPC